MKKTMKQANTILLASLASAAISQAATISWSSTPYTVNGGWGQYLDTGLFVTTGTQVMAENVGGAATTFDGINFAAGTINFAEAHDGYHELGFP